MTGQTMPNTWEPVAPPPPGSDGALILGCRCPVLDNAHGKGYMGVAGRFVYVEDCPLHFDAERVKRGEAWRAAGKPV